MSGDKDKMDEKSTFSGLRKADIKEEKIIARIQKAHRKNYRRSLKLTDKSEEKTNLKPKNNLKNPSIVFTEDFVKEKVNPKKIRHLKNYKEEEDEKPMLFFEISEYNEENENEIKPSDSGMQNTQEQNVNGSGFFNKAVKQEITDWIKHILIAVVVGLLLVVFVVQRNEVVGSSMEPNLMSQDQLLVQKISKLFSSGINYGDIITIDAKGLPYHNGDNNIIKRVIGLPGDFIEIKDGYVYRNGERVEEIYLNNVDTSERKTEYSKVLLGEDEFYILGDNRPVSLDSRTFGPVERKRIVGEVLIRFYPLDHFGKP